MPLLPVSRGKAEPLIASGMSSNLCVCVCVCVCVCACALSPSLGDPMDCSPPGSSVLGISQARMLEWVAMPSSIQGLFPTQGSNLHLLCLLPWQLCSLPLPHLGSPFFEAGCWTIGQRELSLRKLGENLRLGDGRPRSGVMYTSFPCTDGPGPLSYCGCSDPGGEQGGDQQGLGPFGESGA